LEGGGARAKRLRGRARPAPLSMQAACPRPPRLSRVEGDIASPIADMRV